MTIEKTIESMYKNTSDVYDAIKNLNGVLPSNKNLENLATSLATLPIKNSYDPSNPSVEGLKAALQAGDKDAFPANSTIPDTYNGAAFNWVVGHYGTATMSDGSTQEGVYLFADQIVARQAFGSNTYYNQSTINTWLNNTFLPACSDTMKSMVGEISVTGSDAAHAINAKVWLMSMGEIMGAVPSTSNGGGVAWDAWKIRTGLSSPSNGSNNGRIMKESNGNAYYWWTRSFNSTSDVWNVNTSGYCDNYYPSNAYGVVPALFIPKS